MGRYEIDKLMQRINMNPDAQARYIADPAAFVAEWEAIAEADPVDPDPYPLGGRLDDAERKAFVERDAIALYRMGAHPFLLWSWTESVWIHERPRDELVRWYKEQVAAIGTPPDFET